MLFNLGYTYHRSMFRVHYCLSPDFRSGSEVVLVNTYSRIFRIYCCHMSFSSGDLQMYTVARLCVSYHWALALYRYYFHCSHPCGPRTAIARRTFGCVRIIRNSCTTRFLTRSGCRSEVNVRFLRQLYCGNCLCVLLESPTHRELEFLHFGHFSTDEVQSSIHPH